jgi:hypothetical protein
MRVGVCMCVYVCVCACVCMCVCVAENNSNRISYFDVENKLFTILLLGSSLAENHCIPVGS